MSDDDSSVKVALRIRPQLTRELIEGSKPCTSVLSDDAKQVWIGNDHAFTFDHVFNIDSEQDDVFGTVVSLVDGCLDGYNATVLAYGQTGSGKTYTMGTGFDVESRQTISINKTQGIIPRAVHHLFHSIEDRINKFRELNQPTPDFKVSVQFVELYNEEVYDLIECEGNVKPQPSSQIPIKLSNDKQKNESPYGDKSPFPLNLHRKNQIQIREDTNGGIYLVGVRSKPIKSSQEAMDCLYDGALCRTTASTNMNDESSRSHAIFTLHIKQQRVLVASEDSMDTTTTTDLDYSTLSAKFHFVDLAGSERLKRTGAIGDRAKESISINSGLLSLGNVISALGDKSLKAKHVPYRDSKLTRLLQDSLGGNSRTLMIACVSPSEMDFLETLNTLKYANRAKNIRNKVVINQDKNSNMVAQLKCLVKSLEAELLEFKQGKRIPTQSGSEQSDTYNENILLQSELKTLTSRLKSSQATIQSLNIKNANLLAEKSTGTWIMNDNNCDLTIMVQKYIQEIEELSSKLYESEVVCEELRRKVDNGPISFSSPRRVLVSGNSGNCEEDVDECVDTLIGVAKNEIRANRERIKVLKGRTVGTAEEMEEDDDTASDSDSDSDSASEESSEPNYNVELANLTAEINTKQRLIDQLESTKKRMEGMKIQYEDKLLCLMNRIKSTQEEMDKVLSGMNSEAPEGKLKQVKQDYEKKLKGIRQELKKWQVAHKKHDEMIASNNKYEKQIVSLNNEMVNMKHLKIKLMNQIKEENVKRKEMELVRNKEIVQLKKHQRMKDCAIKKLENENLKKDVVLKRKHEEVTFLKKQSQLIMSKKAAGKLPPKFSPLKAKTQLKSIRQKLLKTSSDKQTIENFEKEMLADIQKRTALSSEIENLLAERDKKPDQIFVNNVNDQIDTIDTNIKFLNEKISQSQKNILDLTGLKNDEDLSLVTARLNRSECCYLLEKMYQQNLEDLINSQQLGRVNFTLEQDLRGLRNEVSILRELLQYMYNKTSRDDMDPEYNMKLQLHSHIIGIPNPIKQSKIHPLNQTYTAEEILCTPPSSRSTLNKARRLTSTPNELLGDTFKKPADIFVNPNDFPNLSNKVNVTRGSSRVQRNRRRDTYCLDNADTNMDIVDKPCPNLNATYTTSSDERMKLEMDTTFLDDETNEPIPPTNQPGDNLLKRLTTDPGIIRPHRKSKQPGQNLVQTHTASGHGKDITCLNATNQYLFSGSKDCSAKIWDLEANTELRQLISPSSITSVKYVEGMNSIFTVSGHFIKLWDWREKDCIRTFRSSGSTYLDSTTNVQEENEEYSIKDVVITKSYGMYTTYKDKVKIWDLRYNRMIGSLGGSDGLSLNCLSYWSDETEVFVTGSNCIKVYEFAGNEPTRTINNKPKYKCESHYDSVESLALQGSILFSGSNDGCIKRWDLTDGSCTYTLNNTTQSSITGLQFMPKSESIVSASRDGTLNIWSMKGTLQSFVKTKSNVNCITTNASIVFTGSCDGKVGFWNFVQS